MSEKLWVEESMENHMFEGGERSGDADRMLEKSPTNRILNPQQNVLVIINRHLAKINHDSMFINNLCNEVEEAQLITDGKSRDDFMKVAIEQFQAKLLNAKRSLAEKLL